MWLRSRWALQTSSWNTCVLPPVLSCTPDLERAVLPANPWKDPVKMLLTPKAINSLRGEEKNNLLKKWHHGLCEHKILKFVHSSQDRLYTYLISINWVIIFEGIDTGNRKGHRKADNCNTEAVSNGLLEIIYFRCDRGLKSKMKIKSHQPAHEFSMAPISF